MHFTVYSHDTFTKRTQTQTTANTEFVFKSSKTDLFTFIVLLAFFHTSDRTHDLYECNAGKHSCSNNLSNSTVPYPALFLSSSEVEKVAPGNDLELRKEPCVALNILSSLCKSLHCMTFTSLSRSLELCPSHSSGSQKNVQTSALSWLPSVDS